MMTGRGAACLAALFRGTPVLNLHPPPHMCLPPKPSSACWPCRSSAGTALPPEEQPVLSFINEERRAAGEEPLAKLTVRSSHSPRRAQQEQQLAFLLALDVLLRHPQVQCKAAAGSWCTRTPRLVHSHASSPLVTGADEWVPLRPCPPPAGGCAEAAPQGEARAWAGVAARHQEEGRDTEGLQVGKEHRGG